ncbi:MAG: glycosyltransferase family 39 protein [Actinobacteria bacterium]|nr:glycosyltransferase family 39 protein [Actinomycetota bacterium]MBU1943906.1 glycosyltransferase family 39 protein [Actinomycetota bacterium]MBU2688572.1 glycosyltransferase family 39 protein [Actinomycetota bacterium]
MRRHPLAASAVAVLALYLLTRLLCLGRLPIFFDEAVYIRWSQLAMRQGNFLVSLTDGKPPLHVWLMIPFLKIFSDPLFAGRVASVSVGAFSAVFMVLIGKELADWRLGAVAGALYVICPFTLWYDRVAIVEGPLLAVFLVAVYLAIKAARTLGWYWALGLGAAIGVGLIGKGTAQLLFLIAPAAYLARRPDDSRPNRPLLRWVLMLLGAFVIGIAIFNLLRFSDWFPLMSSRTAMTTKTLGDVVSNPFDILWTNLWEITKTLVVFMTPLLLAASLIGLIGGALKKCRPAYFLVEWLLVVFLVEALISKHWMFRTVLPRFVLSLVPPLLFGAAYFVLEAVRLMLSAEKRKTLGKIGLVSLLVLVLCVPVINDVLIVASPENAILPYWVSFQYITDWPSGWGIEESVRFIEEEAESGPVTVGSNFKGPIAGLPTNALELYLSTDRNVELVPFSFLARQFPGRLREAAREGPTYCVVNMFSPDYEVPDEWPLREIARYPKDGNEGMLMLLYKVVP